MPRFFTHLYNSETLCDERGEEFANLTEARAAARASASELIAEHIAEGKVVDLGHRLEVMDEDGRLAITLTFAELFRGTATAPAATGAGRTRENRL